MLDKLKIKRIRKHNNIFVYMKKINEIRDLLSKYQELFWEIDSLSLDTYPCMDISMNIMKEKDDDMNVDFSGKQRMCTLFFTGSSDYFPAIWMGKCNTNDIDKMPIYLLDLSCSDNKLSEPLGNIRQYVTIILDDYLNCDNCKKYKNEAIQLKKELEKLSNVVIDKGNYVLKLIDE